MSPQALKELANADMPRFKRLASIIPDSEKKVIYQHLQALLKVLESI